MPGTAVGFKNSWKQACKVVLTIELQLPFVGWVEVRNIEQMYPPKSIYTRSLANNDKEDYKGEDQACMRENEELIVIVSISDLGIIEVPFKMNTPDFQSNWGNNR